MSRDRYDPGFVDGCAQDTNDLREKVRAVLDRSCTAADPMEEHYRDIERIIDREPTIHALGAVNDDTDRNVNRLEVVDQNGRRLVLNDVTDVRLEYQDDGRTLKVFVNEEA